MRHSTDGNLHSSNRISYRYRTILAASILTLLIACQKEKKEPPPPIPEHEVRILVSREFMKLFESAVNVFPVKHADLLKSQRVKFKLVERDSLDAARDMASGSQKADAWIASPSSLVDYSRDLVRGLGATSSECLQLFSTKLALAVPDWESPLFGGLPDPFPFETLTQRLTPSTEDSNEQSLKIALLIPHPALFADGAYALAQLASLSGLSLNSSSRDQPMTSEDKEDISFGLRQISQLVSRYSAPVDSSALAAQLTDRDSPVVFLTTERLVRAYNASRNPLSPKLLTIPIASDQMFTSSSRLCISDAPWTSSIKRVALRTLAQDVVSSPELQLQREAGGYVAPEAQTMNSDADKLAEQELRTVIELAQSSVPPSANIFVIDTSRNGNQETFDRMRLSLLRFIKGRKGRDKYALISTSTVPRKVLDWSDSSSEFSERLNSLEQSDVSAVLSGIKSAALELQNASLIGYRKNIIVFTQGITQENSDALAGIRNILRGDPSISLSVYLLQGASGISPIISQGSLGNLLPRGQLQFNAIELGRIEEFMGLSPILW